MNRRRGARCQTVGRTHVASGTLARHRHVGMECARIPARKAGAVASVAVGNRYAGQRFVGNVIRRGALSRRKATGMASGTLLGHHHLGMVPAAGLPGPGAVAGDAVDCRRNVQSRFSGCRGAVVAAGTVGR